MHPLIVGTRYINLMTGVEYVIKEIHPSDNYILIESVKPPIFEAVVSVERLQEWFGQPGEPFGEYGGPDPE